MRIPSSLGHHSFTPRCLVGGFSGIHILEKLKSPTTLAVLPTGAPLLCEWAALERNSESESLVTNGDDTRSQKLSK